MNDVPHAQQPQIIQVMMQVTEMRTQITGMDQKLSTITDAIQAISALDRTMAESMVRQADHTKQLNTLWERYDELSEWRSKQLTDATEAAQRHKAVCEALVKSVEIKTDIANAGVDAINNKFSGASKVLTAAAALFAGLLVAGSTWMVSAVVETKQRAAVIEYQLTAIDQHLKENRNGKPAQ